MSGLVSRHLDQLDVLPPNVLHLVPDSLPCPGILLATSSTHFPARIETRDQVLVVSDSHYRRDAVNQQLIESEELPQTSMLHFSWNVAVGLTGHTHVSVKLTDPPSSSAPDPVPQVKSSTVDVAPSLEQSPRRQLVPLYLQLHQRPRSHVPQIRVEPSLEER